MRRRLGIFAPAERIPGLIELLMRALEFGRAPSARLRDLADAYLTLPLSDFRSRDLRRGAEMVDIGYRFAMQYFEAWMESNGRPWLSSE